MPLSSYSLYGAAVFLGAFLLFFIQPVAGKQLLPFFGGSSSVWAVSLLFFTGMLFLGYAYVYALTFLSRRRQIAVHLFVVGSAVLAGLFFFVSDSFLLFYDPVQSAPALSVLVALILWIGAPYFLLATTGPLMQHWYSASGKEPYALYALSNAASLGALLVYPFVVEPIVSLHSQQNMWAFLFVVYGVVCALIALFHYSRERETEIALPSASLQEGALWVLLAALPAFLLVATTTHVSQTIAPFPLLWIVPLVLYLASFIIAFKGWARSIFTPFLFFVSAIVAWWFTPTSYGDIVYQVVSYLVFLFLSALTCHALLYRARPPASSLSLFYLLLSLGGALGALAGGILAPLMFDNFWEFPLGLFIAGVFAAWILPDAFFPRILNAWGITAAKVLFLVVATTTFINFLSEDDSTPTLSSRNFYGNAQVVFDTDSTSLMHGNTLHGMQFAQSGDALLPTTYYAPGSGVGRAMLYERERRGSKEMRVGVVGLGTGTIAAYCRPQDTYVFYEIDARIETIARSYFGYVPRCEGAEVRLGDGRILLERERISKDAGAYDLLAIDAFSDDTIPVHLLTLEAFDLYAGHLRDEKSILAIHISNRYLDLAPVVFRAAAEIGFNAMLVSDSGDEDVGGSASSWVLLTKSSDIFSQVAFEGANSEPPLALSRPWTDDYSSIFPVLDVPLPWE